MRLEIYQAISHSTKLSHVKEGVLQVLNGVRERGQKQQIGYVSGIISSEGPKNIPRNMRRLEAYTDLIRKQYSFPIFSATDVFGNGMHGKLEEFYFEAELQQKHFMDFWEAVLTAGHVTDMFMTPRWEVSSGAKDEFRIARETGMRLYIVESNPRFEVDI